MIDGSDDGFGMTAAEATAPATAPATATPATPAAPAATLDETSEEALAAEAAKFHEQVKAAETLIGQQAKRIDELAAEIASLEGRLATAETATAELKASRADVEGYRISVEGLRAELNAAEIERASLEQKLEEARAPAQAAIDVAVAEGIANGSHAIASLLRRLHNAVIEIVPKGLRGAVEQRVSPKEIDDAIGPG